MIYLFCAAITDIGRIIQSFALFLHKILASLITGGAGSTFYIAENNFSADIGFPAMEAMNTKVMGIIGGNCSDNCIKSVEEEICENWRGLNYV